MTDRWTASFPLSPARERGRGEGMSVSLTLPSPQGRLVLTQIRTQDTYIRGASALKRGQKLDVHPNRSKDLVRPLPEACSQRLDRVLPVECFSPCQEHLHFKALPDEDLGKDEPRERVNVLCGAFQTAHRRALRPTTCHFSDTL